MGIDFINFIFVRIIWWENIFYSCLILSYVNILNKSLTSSMCHYQLRSCVQKITVKVHSKTIERNDNFQVKLPVKSQSNPSISHTITISLSLSLSLIHTNTRTFTPTHKSSYFTGWPKKYFLIITGKLGCQYEAPKILLSAYDWIPYKWVMLYHLQSNTLSSKMDDIYNYFENLSNNFYMYTYRCFIVNWRINKLLFP